MEALLFCPAEALLIIKTISHSENLTLQTKAPAIIKNFVRLYDLRDKPSTKKEFIQCNRGHKINEMRFSWWRKRRRKWKKMSREKGKSYCWPVIKPLNHKKCSNPFCLLGNEDEINCKRRRSSISPILPNKNRSPKGEGWKKRPWVIANTLLNLKRWDGEGDPKDIPFTTADLWIHIHNLPTRFRSVENIRELSQYFVKFIDCDKAGFEPGRWKRFILLFAENYCLYCGRVGHTESCCEEREEDVSKGGSGEIPGCFEFSICAGSEQRKLTTDGSYSSQQQWLTAMSELGKEADFISP
ncbi:hypothetical protein LINPERPRIM_LOCUS8642 [Linum perenne]